MMLGFVIFGWPKKFKNLGRSLPAHCDHCQNTSIYHLLKARRWITLFFIPVLPLQRAEYYVTCEICEISFELDRNDVGTVKEIRDEYRKWASGELTESEFLDEISTLGADLPGWEFSESPELPGVGNEMDGTPDRGFQ